MPNLNMARYRAGTFMTPDKRYLYSLKGCDVIGGTINNYERLDLFYNIP